MVNPAYAAQQQQHQMQAFPQQQQQQQPPHAGPSTSASFPGVQLMNGASPAAGHPAELQQQQQQQHPAPNGALPNFSREQLTQMSMVSTSAAELSGKHDPVSNLSPWLLRRRSGLKSTAGSCIPCILHI